MCPILESVFEVQIQSPGSAAVELRFAEPLSSHDELCEMSRGMRVSPCHCRPRCKCRCVVWRVKEGGSCDHLLADSLREFRHLLANVN
jgi:hypothetical protein